MTALATSSAAPRRVWSSQEKQTLRSSLEPGLTNKQCAELLPSRTLGAIRSQASRQIPHSQRRSKNLPFSDVSEIIRLARQGLGRHEIQKRLPHRSVSYIAINAYTHGIYFARYPPVNNKRWSADEDKLLLQGVDQQTLAEMCGRPLAAIIRRQRYLKLAGSTADLPSKRWTAEDARIAFDHYTRGIPIPDIAKLLGRSFGAVYTKVYMESRRLHGKKADHRNSQSLSTHRPNHENAADQALHRSKMASNDPSVQHMA